MPAFRVPASYTAGRPLSLGEKSAALGTPVITKGTTAISGGTFGAGAQFWVVTALNADGETLRSNEITATLVATGTQVINWTAITGATGYKVYRGTVAATEDHLVATVGAVTTHTDTGTVGTVASPPTVANTTHTVTYAKGATIAKAKVKAVKNLSALLSRRWIIPNVDPHYRKTKSTTPTPTDVCPPSVRKAL